MRSMGRLRFRQWRGIAGGSGRGTQNTRENLSSALCHTGNISYLLKARLRERFAVQALNERQITLLNKLLDGIEGTLTTSN